MSKVFLFPGQGSQFIGMGKNLFDKYKIVRDTFEEASDTLQLDMTKLCFNGSIKELTRTENAQPAIVTLGIASYRAYMKEVGIQADYFIGHSLGELTALGCSQAINFNDLIKIVRERGILMQDAVKYGDGTMVAVLGLEKNIVESICDEYMQRNIKIAISNYNTPNQVVISGLKKDIDEVTTYLKLKSAKVVPLRVSAPFHSPYMRDAAENFGEILNQYEYHDIKGSVISTVTSKPYLDKKEIASILKEQIYKPVLWQQSIEYLLEKGMDLAIDFGPRSVAKKLVEDNKNGTTAIAISDLDEITDLKKYMIVNNEENKRRITVVTKCLAAAVCTENRNFNEEEYQKFVVEPYKEIKSIQQKIEAECRLPLVGEMKRSLDLLKIIFEAKRVDLSEQQHRFNKIILETDNEDIFYEFLKK